MPNSIKSNSIEMSHWLERWWYRSEERWWGLFLMPLELLMTLLVCLRQFFYKHGIFPSWRSPIPVVVVGNITVGGTGKTPLVLFLLEQLQAQGYKPGIISRGYGGKVHGCMAVTPLASPQLVGDEPLLMAMRAACPVWVGRDRPAAARALIAAHPECDVLISDDGLQHYALQRDFEIMVVDGERRFGNSLLLPFGPLREPLRRVGSVDAVVINGGEAGDWPNAYLMRLNGQRFYKLNHLAKTAMAADFKGKRIHALAGIGNPVRFFDHLRSLGLEFTEQAFPDHHQFAVADLQNVGAEVILMTEKDAVKCRGFEQENIWVLPVKAEVISGLEAKVIEKLESFYGRKTA